MSARLRARGRHLQPVDASIAAPCRPPAVLIETPSSAELRRTSHEGSVVGTMGRVFADVKKTDEVLGCSASSRMSPNRSFLWQLKADGRDQDGSTQAR